MDGPGRAAPALFERVLRGQSHVRCRRVDFAAAENAADADCVVVFGRDALLIADDWSSIDADILADAEPVSGVSDCGDLNWGDLNWGDLNWGDLNWGDEFRAEVAVAGAAWWHPVTEGVRPFVSRFRRNQIVQSFQDESCLFVGRTADEVFPVVWARCDVGRVFGTLLGSAEDFCRPEFVRLALNALDWVGGRK